MKKNKFLLVLSALVTNSLNAAPLVNPSNIPLEVGVSSSVKPNLMFILDDSGSMKANYLGDEAGNNLCKIIEYGKVVNFAKNCFQDYWEAPFMAYDLNKIYYNPDVKYKPGVKYDGTSYGNMTLTTARDNIYQTSDIEDLTKMKEYYYCTKTSPTSTELNNPSICRRNGINHTNNTFNYYTQGYPNTTYKYSVVGPATLSYYDIIPTEYCDANFVNCSSTYSATTPYPAPVRWCAESSVATSATLQSGLYPVNYNKKTLRLKNKCQKNPDDNYLYPRYGNFKRVNIAVSEQENFANWYTYYRTRLLTMKTTVGLSFQKIDSKTRVGFITINPENPVKTSKFLEINDFDENQKQKFYSKLYASTPSGITPLREALSRVGRYFAGVKNGINSGISDDPLQYSCQQNFALLSTDGYWNGNAGKNLSGNTITNEDNINSGYSTRSSGSYDGGLSDSTETLADVAMYYYKTDLRTTGVLSENNVPISSTNPNSSQHMVTYAISLGLNGLLSFSKDYDKGGNQDFEKIKNGIQNWPVPEANSPSAIDDLWHATVNGRGKYYSAQNNSDIINGLNDALNALIAQTSASAAAATSSPNITSTENALYYVTYRTVKWDGEITATTINPTTGAISNVMDWSARTKLNTQVSSSSDSRNIYYVRNTSSGSSLRTFNEGSMNSSELNYFKNKCIGIELSQCANLEVDDKEKIDSGSSLINYLRGQSQYDQNNMTEPLYRAREYVLGDIVNSSPIQVSRPMYKWTDAGYSTFATNNASRAGRLYVGANDGMIHAFDTTTGEEKWAVIPSQMLHKLYKLADTSYSTNHDFYVDGNISVMDAKIDTDWRTILISGMNSGGKGYIALDVTDPNNPSVLWEFCNSSICSVTDSELGYSYGNPIITKRKFDGKWVAYVSAGYDNPTGKGLIYELDLETGDILRKLYTGTGSVSGGVLNQSGIAKINAYYDNFNTDNTALYLYAGDLDGNIWKWDLTSSTNTTATLLGKATDSSGNAQPVTTKVELGKIDGNIVIFAATGQFLNNDDFVTNGIQSIYAIKDNNNNLGKFRSNSSMVKQNMVTSNNISSVNNASVNFNSQNGWFIDLQSQSGERVNIDPILSLGVLNVVSNVPGTSICTAGGEAWIYQVDYAKGTAADTSNSFIGKKMNSGLIVGQVVVQLGTKHGLKNYLTDASGQVIVVSVAINNQSSTSSVVKKHFWKDLIRK